MDVKDIQNYYRQGGAIFFFVYFDKNYEKHAVFYIVIRFSIAFFWSFLPLPSAALLILLPTPARTWVIRIDFPDRSCNWTQDLPILQEIIAPPPMVLNQLVHQFSGFILLPFYIKPHHA